jgi:hypothetical protein
MAHYIVPPSSNQRLLRLCAYGSIGLMLLFLALSRSRWLELDDRLSHALGWSAVGMLIVGMVGIYVLIFRDSVGKVWRKVSFDLTDEKIIRVMDGRPPIELLLSEITFLGESRMGLIVRSGEPSKGFVIPRAVDGFEDLKQQLNEHCKVSATDNKASFIPVLPLVLTIVLYAILFTAKTGLVVLIAGVVALLFQGWSIFSMRNIFAKTKSPKLVMLVFIFSWLVLLWLVYQRASSALNS